MDSKHFKKGEVIFQENDIGRTMYEVTAGTVGIFLDYGKEGEEKLVEVRPGEIFGEMAVIDGFPRSATAVAVEDTDALEIPGQSLELYFSENPERIYFLMRRLSDRLRDLTQTYTEACGAINEAKGIGYAQPSESLWQKIKRFAGLSGKMSAIADSNLVDRRYTEKREHGEGYVQRIVNLVKGDIVFKQGDESFCMYDIHRGTVGIYSAYNTPEEKLLTKLTANQFFGEMGMIENKPRSATAVALDNGACVELIYPGDLNELFRRNPEKVMMILTHLSSRLRQLTVDYYRACHTLAEIEEAIELDRALPAETRAWIEYYNMMSQYGIGWY